MSLKTQAKVLRVLQEQTMEAVGGVGAASRWTRACSRRPTRICRPRSAPAGSARTCISGSTSIPIFVPPLRDRQEDIPLLADHFMAEFAREYGRRVKSFERRAPARCCSSYRVAGQRARAAERHRAADDHGARRRHLRRRTSASSTRRRWRPIGRQRPRRQAASTLHEARDQFERDLHPAHAGGAAGEHVADGRRPRRRAEQPLSKDEGVRHRALATRARRRKRSEQLQ